MPNPIPKPWIYDDKLPSDCVRLNHPHVVPPSWCRLLAVMSTVDEFTQLESLVPGKMKDEREVVMPRKNKMISYIILIPLAEPHSPDPEYIITNYLQTVKV